MKTATGTTVIQGGRLIDGTGAPAVDDSTVVIEDGRIAYAGPTAEAPTLPNGVALIDATGTTVMPGLVEAHWHASYFNVAVLEDLDIAHPPEVVALHSAVNARAALESGYTAARSAGCLFNTDVALAGAIDADVVPGPRFVPSGQEICGAGGLMDWNPEFRKIGMEGVILVVDGADQARSAARRLVKSGAQWLKTYPTGDAAAPGTNDQHTLSMTYEEMEAVVQVAHNHRRKVFGHCRATEGIKMALQAGFDSIEHGTFMDQECLDMMLANDVPCVPALQFELASVEHGPEFDMPQEVVDEHQETLEAGAESARMIQQAGGTLGMGGDYGFAWNPHGQYAKELSFFVDYVGFSPLETLVCGTRNGAKIMGIDKETGTLEAGKLADLLIVEGDVLADIALLEDQSNLRAVMQGGIVKAGTMAAFQPTTIPTP
ncbi:MAG: amidohydrolase family protein [Acidimicrobiia bacterium]|nr:amidohydrolase family protein [Acidimicrobiia bacterium]